MKHIFAGWKLLELRIIIQCYIYMGKSSLQLEQLADEPNYFLIKSSQAIQMSISRSQRSTSPTVSNHNKRSSVIFLWLNIYFQALPGLIN